MSFAAAQTIPNMPRQWCAGQIESMEEPRVARNGKEFIVFSIKGIGASPDAKYCMFFNTEWFKKGFDPRTLDVREQAEYARTINNDSKQLLGQPMLRNILGDENYVKFGEYVHSKEDALTAEDIYASIRGLLLENRPVFGYVLVQDRQRVELEDGTVEWKNKKTSSIKDWDGKKHKYMWSGTFPMIAQTGSVVASMTKNPRYDVSHITAEVAGSPVVDEDLPF